jgi:phosphatidylethanolamine/phosphatidyl-N-methylethanolamine N-methyltransferase
MTQKVSPLRQAQAHAQELGSFWGAALKNPRGVGAAFPSGPALAKKMASHVKPGEDGWVVELGPGTGVVTQALLDRGVCPKSLLLVEYSKDMAAILRKRFAHVKLSEGDAARLPEFLSDHGCEPGNVRAIVSSLPLKSLPPKMVGSILEASFHVLKSDGVFVQFTYHLHKPALPKHHKVKHKTGSVIWANIPPARVDAFHFV